MFGEESAPNAMGMENRTGALFGSEAVKEGFRAAFWLAGESGFAVFIDNHKVVDTEVSFVFAACGDQQL